MVMDERILDYPIPIELLPICPVEQLLDSVEGL